VSREHVPVGSVVRRFPSLRSGMLHDPEPEHASSEVPPWRLAVADIAEVIVLVLFLYPVSCRPVPQSSSQRIHSHSLDISRSQIHPW
jgi:hypothetical protein